LFCKYLTAIIHNITMMWANAPVYIQRVSARGSRDFPLASSPTPDILQKFKFVHGNGQEATFFESTDLDDIDPPPQSPGIDGSVLPRKRTSVSQPDGGELRPGKKQHTLDSEGDSDSPSDGVDGDRGSPHFSLPSPSASPANSAYESDELKCVTGLTAIQTLPASPSLGQIPAMIDSFDDLPARIKSYVLYSLLKRCDRSTLSIMSEIIVPALRCDFLSLLPLELSHNILGYLDCKSLCRAAQVSKTWKTIVDSSELVWKNLLEKDDFVLCQEDVVRAMKEQWDYTSWGRCSSNGITIQPDPTVNLFKAIYRRKFLIHNNWMNPKSTPKHLRVSGHGRDVVTCLQFDDDRIVTGSDDHTINVYETKTGKLVQRFAGHEGGVWALKYYNKNILISGSTDRTVRVWDIEQGRCTHVFYGHTSTVRCLDIIEPVVVAEEDGCVKYIPEMPIIVTGSRDASLRMWKLPQPGDESYLPLPQTETHTDPYFLKALRGHTNSVRAISGYGNTIVSGSYDTTVRVWDVNSGECRWELTGHAQRVYSAVLDHKRNRCISGSMDWFVKVWCTETGTLLYTLEGHTSLVGLLDLNRTTLVSAAADSTLRVWNPETGAFLHKLQGHQGAITCFQHDESKVVSGSEKTLKLWNIRSGTLIRDLLEDLSGIWQVCFDERRCVAAVKRDGETFLEVLDFDYDPYAPPEPGQITECSSESQD
jgi:F-box and WD-40 domain protein CDC4